MKQKTRSQWTILGRRNKLATEQKQRRSLCIFGGGGKQRGQRTEATLSGARHERLQRGRSPTGPGRKGQLSVVKGSTTDLAKAMPSGRNVKDYTAFTEKHVSQQVED